MINIGVGFATGRKNFQTVLKTYINNWLEHGIIKNENIRIHLFIAYDLKYENTSINDYKNIPEELASHVDSIHFLGSDKVKQECDSILHEGILDESQIKLLFGDGYAKKRNSILYFAIKNKMDRLIFFDDDEYPMAVYRNNKKQLVWTGQSVLGTHLKHIGHTDITHGHHCGFISPIPKMNFNDTLQESDFKLFVETISNDIINWESIKTVLNNNGATYARREIMDGSGYEVKEESGMKFISGANLCFNLKNFKKLPPFYNPPGARGEDTFMSTSLTHLNVEKVPCYTFHDGFGLQQHLLNGVLPLKFPEVNAANAKNMKRFMLATIGWIRYKPLLTYITNQEEYEVIIQKLRDNLVFVVPRLNLFFKTKGFSTLLIELNNFDKKVQSHYNSFNQCKAAWQKLMNNIILKE